MGTRWPEDPNFRFSSTTGCIAMAYLSSFGIPVLLFILTVGRLQAAIASPDTFVGLLVAFVILIIGLPMTVFGFLLLYEPIMPEYWHQVDRFSRNIVRALQLLCLIPTAGYFVYSGINSYHASGTLLNPVCLLLLMYLAVWLLVGVWLLWPR